MSDPVFQSSLYFCIWKGKWLCDHTGQSWNPCLVREKLSNRAEGTEPGTFWFPLCYVGIRKIPQGRQVFGRNLLCFCPWNKLMNTSQSESKSNKSIKKSCKRSLHAMEWNPKMHKRYMKGKIHWISSSWLRGGSHCVLSYPKTEKTELWHKN